MDAFEYRDGHLCCENVPAAVLAETYGTPAYVYSQDTLLQHYDRLHAAFAVLDPLVCYSIKSCQNTHICKLLAEKGSGFDVVSGGELYRALQAGADPAKIVFAGVGKTDDELREALAADIGYFNIESESELAVLAELARETGKVASAALRVNPDVDAKTHAYTTTGTKENKFGVSFERALDVFEKYRDVPSIRLRGLHLHIGSPVNDPQSYAQSIKVGLGLVDDLRNRGFELDVLNIGGGYGAFYKGGEAPSAADYAAVINPLLRDKGLRLLLEPGRSIAGNAGILLTRVVHVKSTSAKQFVIVDASMNELLRPALYDAYHFIWPVDAGLRVPPHRGPDQPFDDLVTVDVVGPVCETGDFLARGRALPPLRRGDLLAVFTAGAYAMTMASQYNSRPRAPEVLVTGGDHRLIRRRETYADLVAAEQVADA